MAKPRLYGADYSVYVRIVRLVLAEKDVDYTLVPIDIFAKGGPPAWYADLNPFRRIPAFEHAGLRLFETTAIARYVDEAFEGPVLQPADPRSRAVMNQAIGILDAYAYRTLVWDIYVEMVSKPRRGAATDEALVAAALPRAETCFVALAALKTPGRWFLGERITLADLHAAPMFAYFAKAPVAGAMLETHPALAAWWNDIQLRTSFIETEPTS